jgi:hypothetical protein
VVSAGREVRIALPGFADSVARLAGQHAGLRLPAAEWLLARGRPADRAAPDWREWLLAGAGLDADILRRLPSGPSSVAAGFAAGGTRTWARAEPVHLLTAIDHLQLAAPVPLPLDRAESSSLLETLNAHLAGSGFELQAHPGGGWLCRCPEGLQCDTTDPLEAIGRNLRELLPGGRDAVRVRSLVNELQMLLHEHPVNQGRAARGLPSVNSVWLWGFGADRAPGLRATGDLLSDDAWLSGLWQRHGGTVRPTAALARVLAGAGPDLRVASLAAIDGRPVAAALQALDSTTFAPLRAAFVESRVARVSLHTGRRVIDLAPAARWAFWRRSRPLAAVPA